MSELLRKPVFHSEQERNIQSIYLQRLALRARDFVKDASDGINYPDNFEGLHPDELLYLGERILNARTIGDAYDILASKPSVVKAPHETYYDRVIGIQHKRAYAGLEATIAQVQPPSERMLDIATGTGEVALKVAPKVKHVVAIDIVPSLLHVADTKLTAANVAHQIQQMNAVEVDFPDNFIDFATANGLGPYINASEYVQMMHRLHRILRPGGKVYEYTADRPNPLPEYMTSPRGELVRAIAQTLLSKTESGPKYQGDYGSLLGKFRLGRVPLPGASYPDQVLIFQKV